MAKISKKDQIRRITICAVLSALSLVLMITIRFPIFPSAAFYEMEFSDVPILICSGLFGPVYAIVSLFFVCLIQALTVSAASGFIGFVMHFLSSGLMIITLYYLRKAIKGIKGVILSSILGIVVMTLVMIPMNMWLVGEFMGIDIKGFVEGFLAVCIGFNLIKASLNVTIYNLISPVVNKEFAKITGKESYKEY